MSINFQVVAAPLNIFRNFFSMTDEELKAIDSRRIIATDWPGFPCRVSLEDAQPDEKVILTNYAHHKANSPYKSDGPIFVREMAVEADLEENEIPKMLLHRELSVRAYNKKGMMVNARTLQGDKLESCIRDFFSNEKIAYLHVHNAAPGCFNCAIERA